MTEPNEQFVIAEVRGTTGVLTLNRPKALNSLNYDMVTAIDAALREWATDDAVEQVVIHSNSKHFCSGGDVKSARQEILDGNEAYIDEFFAFEYAMNNYIAEFPKPYVALISGVNMGGGMGVSAHGSHFVVAEGAFASMPEMNIGYVTDVGMSWTLQNLPKRPSTNLGKFLGLTGYRLTPDDMLALGLATHKVETVEGLVDRIAEDGLGVLDEVALEAGDSELARWFDDIEAAFGGSWEEIEARLDGEFKTFVEELTAKASPSALVAAAELFEANAKLDLAGALENERVLGELMRREPDFAEGVRAVLVDKDQSAQFEPQPDPAKYREVLR
ncbi:enoyl-CoA hydratase/isomerase family protein [Corynebacterium aquatimens]|uniref:3-hydroxyisobutyryl-CoA hydrolase n=1 Tax=Corynebacterium TaxID=1716 RepID=UPI001F1E459F|nr:MULTISPECIES: 3-hydroxyisobutyryl-CoA hydrolase [Corynebacterium]QYH20029.1 enoyl-CoA hydratase/isomerase family protein [Corynebacterium aquatimens]UIZ92768.1 enoyl-CoA hydratase/isomerase family protein [Corynebacterium sp. CNCTC7651]